MRNAFSAALAEVGKRDPQVLLLTGDHGYALFDEFRNNCPKQYINAGIAEQNMVGVAAGLAKSGFKPIVYGLSAFVPIRVLEQIKMDVCHENLPVTFIGDGAGFVYSHLGTSHQSNEDIACTRAIPNLTVFSPADRFEMSRCMALAYQLKRPVYLRMGKADLGDVHSHESKFDAGDVLNIKEGPGRVHFIATGSMVRKALEVSEYYEGAGVSSVPTIKPINCDQITDICKNHDLLVVMEEHSVLGGLGSLIAEIATERAPVRVCRIGVNDRFSEYCGTYAYLMNEHHLDCAAIRQKIDGFING